jgi:kynureninase
VPLEQVAGFLALRTPRAPQLSRSLRARGVFTDVRGDLLRMGPAPYLADEQLEAAIETLGDITARFSG